MSEASQAAERIGAALEGCDATQGADKPYEVYESFRDMLARACHPEALRALLEERDELVKDAARWQWLSAKAKFADCGCPPGPHWWFQCFGAVPGWTFPKIVDSAMSAEAQK